MSPKFSKIRRVERDPIFVALGRCIRRRRVELGMTQGTLSTLATSFRNRVSLFECGHTQMPLSTLRRYAAALQMPVADLMRAAEEELRWMERGGAAAPLVLPVLPESMKAPRRNIMSKLDERGAAKVIAQIAALVPTRVIAADTGLSPQQIIRIKLGRSWAHLPRPWLQPEAAE